MSGTLNARAASFDLPVFCLPKEFQQGLENRIRLGRSGAEVLQFLIHTHPEAGAGP